MLFAVIIAVGLVAGSSTSNIGGIHLSREVAEQVERFDAKPNNRYWYLNQENCPYGVIGLESTHWINDPAWREVDARSDLTEPGLA